MRIKVCISVWPRNLCCFIEASYCYYHFIKEEFCVSDNKYETIPDTKCEFRIFSASRDMTSQTYQSLAKGLSVSIPIFDPPKKNEFNF